MLGLTHLKATKYPLSVGSDCNEYPLSVGSDSGVMNRKNHRQRKFYERRQQYTTSAPTRPNFNIKRRDQKNELVQDNDLRVDKKGLAAAR